MAGAVKASTNLSEAAVTAREEGRGRPSEIRTIDSRLPRFNQAVLALVLLVSFALRFFWTVPVWAIFLLGGVVAPPKGNPVQAIFTYAIKPRLGPPKSVKDPRPLRFSASLGFVFLSGSTLAYLGGLPTVAWALALLVAFLATVAAVFDICVGCEFYVRLMRAGGGSEALRRSLTIVGRQLPRELSKGSRYLLFTSQYCIPCAELKSALDNSGQSWREITVEDEPAAFRRLRIRATPVLIQVTEEGVAERYWGPDSVGEALAVLNGFTSSPKATEERRPRDPARARRFRRRRTEREPGDPPREAGPTPRDSSGPRRGILGRQPGPE